MKLRELSLAVFVALVVAATGPAVLRADTVYYREAGVPAIQSASGTIVRETDDRLEITTTDGRTVSIARENVYNIVREAAPVDVEHDPTDGLEEEFPAASALASRATFGGTRSPLDVAYHYGFKGGVNISNVPADPQELEDAGSLLGYAFGMWWGVPLSRLLTIQTEALFSMKGDSESVGGYTASTRLGYFELPVLARVGFLHNAPVRPSLFVGPSLGINVSAKSKLEGDGGEVGVDVKDQVGTLDLALVVGGGLEFGAGRRTFGVDVRYSRGLRDISDGANGSARNEVIAVMGSIGLR